MADLFAFARTHARFDDPDTSKRAAERAATLARQHQVLIVNYLQRISPAGATVDEIGAALELGGHQIGRRMKDLEIDGHVRHEGTRRMDSGRQGRVWFYVRSL